MSIIRKRPARKWCNDEYMLTIPTMTKCKIMHSFYTAHWDNFC